jgi:predicted acylesterase/phospholipase RssA
MRDFYALSGVDFHVMTTQFKTLTSVNISHKTHPEWRVLDAVYASAALPSLFPPFIDASSITTTQQHPEMYVDGAVLDNYPVSNCILDYDLGDKTDTIFGLCNSANSKMEKVLELTAESTMLEYMQSFFIIMEYKLQSKRYTGLLKHEIQLNTPGLSISNIYKVTKDREQRIKILEHGRQQWLKYVASAR